MVSERLRRFRLKRAEQRAAGRRVLPAIAAKADDLEAIKKSVEDAAAVGGPLWLSYLFGLFYIALAAGGVTHKDLLLENPVELPFLSLKLHLTAFFVIAPILFLISHAYTMAHFALLADKAKRFHMQLKEQIDGGHENAREIRERLRQLLPINLFVQFLAGPKQIRKSWFGRLLSLIAWATLVLGPVLILLLLQLQFLPYHDSRVSWEHRAIILFDLALIWWLWGKILSGRSEEDEGDENAKARSVVVRQSGGQNVRRWARFKAMLLWLSYRLTALSLTSIVALFSCWIATFPNEWREWPYSLAPTLEWKAANVWAFGEVDAHAHNITGTWPHNSLRLNSFDIYDALKVDDPNKLSRKQYTLDLQSRHLEFAVLGGAKFGNVNLNNAYLEGGILDGADLRGALLVGAHLQGASLIGAQLQAATLVTAELQGSSLVDAQLQGASLTRAKLQGALLDGARLEGASFEGAQLQAASFVGSKLQGAVFYMKVPVNAELVAALNGSDFSAAFLWRTDFSNLARPNPNSVLVRVKEAVWAPATLSFQYQQSPWVTVPWTGSTYADLWRSMESGIAEGAMRDAAMKRIGRLDCKNRDNTLASCDPAAALPQLAMDWRRMLEEKASSDDAVYEIALASELRKLVCDGTPDAIHILRGILYVGKIMRGPLVTESRLVTAGREGLALVDIIKSKDCPVSTALTEADLSALKVIKDNDWMKRNLPWLFPKSN